MLCAVGQAAERHDNTARREPYPAVMMRGTATVATANDAATVEEIRAITRRYIVPEDIERYIARWPDLRTIVTIVPAHIASWSDAG